MTQLIRLVITLRPEAEEMLYPNTERLLSRYLSVVATENGYQLDGPIWIEALDGTRYLLEAFGEEVTVPNPFQ